MSCRWHWSGSRGWQSWRNSSGRHLRRTRRLTSGREKSPAMSLTCSRASRWPARPSNCSSANSRATTRRSSSRPAPPRATRTAAMKCGSIRAGNMSCWPRRPSTAGGTRPPPMQRASGGTCSPSRRPRSCSSPTAASTDRDRSSSIRESPARATSQRPSTAPLTSGRSTSCSAMPTAARWRRPGTRRP